MAVLAYRPDWPAARERLTVWWNGGDIGRAAMMITAPRAEPLEDIAALPTPRGWVTHYSTKSRPYRINLAQRACIKTHYLGEAVPYVASGDLGANCLALFLGCRGVEAPGTVWFEPCISEPETAHFRYDAGNFYWRFCLDVYREVSRLSRGRFLQQFPDLIEGLDTLAAMRGTEEFLADLIDRPDWVHNALRQITDRYFHYYDIFYDLIRDEVGGSVFWCWAPGRMVKLQCDVSAMISPAMFREFMVPILNEMTERVSYSMYHWDGPVAIQHHDALLSLPRLNMIQWTPGSGVEPAWHKRWWPLFHRTLDAGKKLYIQVGGGNHTTTPDILRDLKREFGIKSKGMLLGLGAATPRQAEEYLNMMEC